MRLSRSGRSIQAPAKYKENLEEKVRTDEKVRTEEGEEIATIGNSKSKRPPHKVSPTVEKNVISEETHLGQKITSPSEQLKSRTVKDKEGSDTKKNEPRNYKSKTELGEDETKLKSDKTEHDNLVLKIEDRHCISKPRSEAEHYKSSREEVETKAEDQGGDKSWKRRSEDDKRIKDRRLSEDGRRKKTFPSHIGLELQQSNYSSHISILQVADSPLENQDVFFYSKPPPGEHKGTRLDQISRNSLDRVNDPGLDRANDPGLDRQNIEHSMERQNLMIQENQRLTLEEQLALLHAGQIQHEGLDEQDLEQDQEDFVHQEDLLIHQVSPQVMVNEDGIEITVEDEEDEDEDEDELANTKIFPPWYQRLSNMLTMFMSKELLVDVHLQGADGELVSGHQLILAHVSPVLAGILSGVRQDCNEESITILLPEISSSQIREFMYSLYTGNLPDDVEARTSVYSISKLLGVQHGNEDLIKLRDSGELFDQDQLVDQAHLVDQDHLDEDHHIVVDEHHRLVKQEVHRPESTSEVKDLELESGRGRSGQEIRSKQVGSRDDVQKITYFKENSENEILGDHKVQVVRTENGDILIVTCDDTAPESMELELQDQHLLAQEHKPIHQEVYHVHEDQSRHQGPGKPQEKGGEAIHDRIRELQKRECVLCQKSAISHKSKDEKSKGFYTCCKDECSESGLKTIRSFHQHVHVHKGLTQTESLNGVKYEPADKPCPLCFKPRIEHKNRELSEEDKGNHKGNLYKCCQCAAARLSAKKFFTHMENHVAKKHVCTVCTKGYSYKHLLDEHHWKMHGDGQYLWLTCPYENCDYKARYKQTLHTHVTEHHQGIKRKHQDGNTKVTCPNCNKVLMKWYYRQHHSKTCSQTNNILKCDICKKEGFINNTTLQNHVRLKHSSDRPFACEYCSLKYATAMSLSSHRARKHGVNARGEEIPRKMYSCAQCNKLLTSSIKLKTHIEVIHEGRRDFACKYCGKRFTSKSNLQIHEGSQHTGILPYNCQSCEKSFARKQQLKIHRAQAHNDIASREPIGQLTDRSAVDQLTDRTADDQLVEPESADHQIISEQFDQDGHFYVVDDIDAVHGVQVGDVIIPMELVEEGECVEMHV